MKDFYDINNIEERIKIFNIREKRLVKVPHLFVTVQRVFTKNEYMCLELKVVG